MTGDNHGTGGDFRLSTRQVRALMALLAGYLAVRLLAMATIPFTDTTEARYGEIARKMVETNNWITPWFDHGVPFWGKPPLHTWLAAGGMELFGINEFAARLPILLTSLAVLALIWVWVRDMVGRNAALISVTVLASMAMFYGAAAFVMTDMAMTLGTTMAMVGFWYAIRDTPHPGWGRIAFAGLAIGMLAKGPVAVVIAGIPVFFWLTFTRRWHHLGRLPWLSGSALFLILTVPWYAAAEIATPGFLRYFIIGEHYERFVVSGWKGDLYGSGHARPKGIIWLYFLAVILPWTLALLALLPRPRAVFTAFRADRDNWLLYLLLWTISPLLLFTPAANLLPAYALPGLPAAAILIVELFGRVRGRVPGAWTIRGFAGVALGWLAIFAVLAVMAGWAPGVLNLKSQKRLIAAAHEFAPDGDIYMVGGRSFSGDFYTNGKARVIALSDLATLKEKPQALALSVPNQLAAAVAALDFERIGRYGRRELFVKPAATETD